MSDVIGLFLIGTGLALDLVGCIGLVRMPDVYNRLQTSTKCVSLGTCLILSGTCCIVGVSAASMKMFLCIIYVLLTAPVAAHAISRGAHRSGIKLSKESVVDQYAEDKEGEA